MPNAGMLGGVGSQSVVLSATLASYMHHGRRKAVAPPPRIPDPTPNNTSTSLWTGEPWNAAQEAKDLLPETLAVVRKLKLEGRIWQGIGGDPDSWGTHYADGYRQDPVTHKWVPYGGAVDIDMTGVPDAQRIAYTRAFRANGMAAWLRYKSDGFANDHIHRVDPIAPNLTSPDIRLDKDHQVQQYFQGLLGTRKSRDNPRTGADKRVPITPQEIAAARKRQSQHRHHSYLYR